MDRLNFILTALFFMLIIDKFEGSLEPIDQSSIFELSYYGKNSKAYEITNQFLTSSELFKLENSNYLKCLCSCNDNTNCNSVVYTKYNNLNSLCCGLSSIPDLNNSTLLTLTNSNIIEQKILNKKKSKLFFLIKYFDSLYIVKFLLR